MTFTAKADEMLKTLDPIIGVAGKGADVTFNLTSEIIEVSITDESEMFDMGWIEYRDSVMSSKAIFATPRGQYIHEIVTDVLADIECLGGA